MAGTLCGPRTFALGTPLLAFPRAWLGPHKRALFLPMSICDKRPNALPTRPGNDVADGCIIIAGAPQGFLKASSLARHLEELFLTTDPGGRLSSCPAFIQEAHRAQRREKTCPVTWEEWGRMGRSIALGRASVIELQC